MKIDIRSRGQSAAHRALLTGLLLSAVFMPAVASAALGGDVSSVVADQQRMQATSAVQSNSKYSVREITTPYGTVVREYVSPAGKVFGVTWRGSFLPDFQQILGGYYGAFAKAAQDAKTAQPRRSHNEPLSVVQPDFVMHSVGRTREYAGHAYVPGIIPPGVDAQEIR